MHELILSACNGLRNGPAEFCCCFDPLLDNLLYVAESMPVGLPIGHTFGEFGDLGHESVILGTPIDDDFIFDIHRY